MTTLKKFAASLLWDASDVLAWIAEQFLAPRDSEGIDPDRPDDQYPVGTLVYTRAGFGYRLNASGRWEPVERDGEPLEPDYSLFDDIYYDDPEDDC